MTGALLYTLLAALLITLPAVVFANAPDYTRLDDWPAGMAIAHLKNAGVLDNTLLNAGRIKGTRLASQIRGQNSDSGLSLSYLQSYIHSMPPFMA